jgi:hypothetical protein
MATLQKNKPYAGVYENYDWEKVYGPKQWVEYPKAIPTGPHGQFKVVQNAEEEKVIRAALQEIHDNTPPYQEPHVADNEKDVLISRARELKIPINTQWSKKKLLQVIADKEAEVDDLPPEDLVDPKPLIAPILAQADETENENEDLHTTLLNQAKHMGIHERNMHLWGVPRLKAAIAEEKAKQK